MSRANTTTFRMSGFVVELTRKQIKAVRLGVRFDGTVRLSAPPRITIEELTEVVHGHRDWILAQQAAMKRRQPPVEDLGAGGRVLLWGCWHEVNRVTAAQSEATIHAGKVWLRAPDDAGAERAMDRLRRRELRQALDELAPRWEDIIGRRPSRYTFRAMTSRWGSCNVVTGHITLNVWLVQRPRDEFIYVLVHELAHLLERGHGPRFRAVMDEALPQWRGLRKELQTYLPPRR